MTKTTDSGLEVVDIKIPEGRTAQGTRVLLSDGSYLRGIESISIHAGPDNHLWMMSINLYPKFNDPLTIQALVHKCAVVAQELNGSRLDEINKQMHVLQAERDYLISLDDQGNSNDVQTLP